jgi:iron complex outermembrane receptor protein
VRSWNQSATVYAANGPITFGQAEHTPYDQFLTQELRLASNGNSRVTWQAGFFGYDNQIKDTNLIALSDGALVADVVAKRATQDAGLFGEATYHIRDDWRLTAGLRLDYTGVSTDESYTSNLNLGVFGPEGFSLPTVPVTATLSGDAGSRDYRNITYRARLEHDLTPVNLLYAQVSTGYLPGNVEVGTISSPRGNVPVPLSFSEENLTAWEIGSKNRFLGNTLQLDGDVYFNDYRGYQDTLQTGASDNPTFVVLGIPARMIGTELEAEYRPTAKDNLGMTLGYIDTKFYNVPALYAEYVAQRQILGISPFTLSASYEHDFNLADGSTLSVKSDADYFSSFDSGALTPATAAAGKDAYVRVNSQILGNLSVTWASASGRYSVSGYIRNLADNRYKNTGGISLNYTATGEAQYSTTGRQYDPRTVGILEHIAF